MREIKFRAWVDGQLLYYKPLFDSLDMWFAEPKKFKVMQFTGFKDTNGKEIYEGDILKGRTWKEPFAMRTSTLAIGQVKYVDYQGFCWCGLLPNGYRTFPTLKECEIIGNIYENSELLNSSTAQSK